MGVRYYTDEQLKEALTHSGVSQFLDKTPNGLASSAGENGSNFSGGQRQRIAIARALIQKTPILILDEGTSALDKLTSQEIESRLLALENLTLISITHKLSEESLDLYDEIIYMENGYVVEVGHWEELLNRKERFYQFYAGHVYQTA